MTTTTSGAPVLEARGLVKKYGNVTAINGADFELRAGEVLAVIGDNGAGKTSLIKALAGAVVPDSGEMLMNGTPVSFKNTRDARAAGIETVYQDLAVVQALDIASNLYLGREVRRRGGLAGSLFRRLDMPRMREEASQHLADLKIGIKSVNQAVETLSGGQRQGVAVARAAAFGKGVIIMDEPTAALGVRESGQVIDLIQSIRDRGIPRGAHQPRHAARVRGRRPHSHSPARSARRGGRRPEDALDVRGGGAHDGCGGADR